MSKKSVIFKPNDVLLGVIRDFRRKRPYTGGRNEQFKKFNDVLDFLSILYRLEAPKLYVTDPAKTMTRFDEYLQEHLGCYDDITTTISMRKFSVLTLLHEFRHYLQYRWKGFLSKQLSKDKEKDANAWSKTLFELVFKGKQTNENGYKVDT